MTIRLRKKRPDTGDDAAARHMQEHAVELAETLSAFIRDDLVFVLVLGSKNGEHPGLCVSALGSDQTAILLRAALAQVEGEPAKREPQ
jgi:hypothetical protein